MEAETLDDLIDDSNVAVHRERAKAILDDIAQQAKQALADAGIDTPVFFLVPNSGDSILTFGTPGNPGDELWSRVAEVILPIVEQYVGLDRTRCREVVCASTDEAQQDALA